MAAVSNNKNYLSQADIKLIQNKIIDIFGEETNKELSLNISALVDEINYIAQKVQIKEFQSGSSKKYRLKRSSIEKRRLMAEAYLIIFKVREYLLNEVINYRYYYNTPDTAKVIEFKEDNILNFIKFGKEGLKIAENILKRQEENQQYQNLIDRHYMNLMAGIQKASDSNFQLVHSNIMSKYENMNPGLRKQTGKGTGRYQVFTMGHVFEAMDIAFSEAIENNQIDNYDAIEKYMYGKYLNYDSVPGTQGGDNPISMTQIKANAADLLDYNTLLKDLEVLKNIFNLNNIDKNKIRENIKNLYINNDKYQDINDLNNAINNALNKVINSINKST